MNIIDSFNKSHACAYGKISAICAWLYANYPNEFIASSLTIELTQQEPNIQGLIREAVANNINILPADINLSDNEFIPTKEGIRIPLSCIGYVGINAFNTIKLYRPYNSFEEFLVKVPKKQVNGRVVKYLVKAGAFDSLYANRSELLEKLNKIRNITKPEQVYFYCDEVQMLYEKQAYGFSLTKHPLDGYTNRDIKDFNDNDNISIIGLVTDVLIKKDKNGNEMAFLTMDNKVCSYRAVIFARTYMQYKGLCSSGAKLNVIGKKDRTSVLVNMLQRI